MATSTGYVLDPEAGPRARQLELRARQVVEGFITGLHRSPLHGFSVEFAEHRAYQPGENPRAIDWRVFGRTERLYVRRFEEETNLRAHLVLDVSDSMRYPIRPSHEGPSKLSYAANLAAALATLLMRQRDAVGLTLYDQAVLQHLPAHARGSWLPQLLQALSSVLNPQQVYRRGTQLPAVIEGLVPRLGRRALVIILADYLMPLEDLPALFRALSLLRYAKHEVLLLRVLHEATELRLDLPDEPLILKDMESGQERRVEPHQLRETYQAQQTAYTAALMQGLRQMAIPLVAMDLSTPYDRALMAALHQRRHLP